MNIVGCANFHIDLRVLPVENPSADSVSTVAGNSVLNTAKLTSILAIASLLFGNVAGWVHIGHHHHSHGHAHAEVAQVAEQHGCCHHHHHCHDDEGATKESEPDQDPVHHEHDSDNCSVCRNFFASRHALPTIGQTVAWQPAEISDALPVVSDLAPQPIFLSGHSSRGPPRV